MVAATTPLYCTPLIGHTLEAEMEELIGSTRLAASWIHANFVDELEKVGSLKKFKETKKLKFYSFNTHYKDTFFTNVAL